MPSRKDGASTESIVDADMALHVPTFFISQPNFHIEQETRVTGWYKQVRGWYKKAKPPDIILSIAPQHQGYEKVISFYVNVPP